MTSEKMITRIGKSNYKNYIFSLYFKYKPIIMLLLFNYNIISRIIKPIEK